MGPLKQSDGSITVEESEMCRIFLQKFCSVFVEDTREPIVVYIEPRYTMDVPRINYMMVLELLKDLDVSSAPGPDGIHPQLLKSCSVVLAYPLTKIFQLVLNQQYMPAEWCKSIIV